MGVSVGCVLTKKGRLLPETALVFRTDFAIKGRITP